MGVSSTKSTTVKSGETISDIVNRMLGKPKGTPTKEHWPNVHRKDLKSGKLTRIDPNHIRAGETLYYLSQNANSKPKSPPPSDGVLNADPRPLKDEGPRIRQDAALAAQYIKKAIERLEKLTPQHWSDFREAFNPDDMSMVGAKLTDRHVQLAKDALLKYRKMQSDVLSGKITYYVQDSEVKTPNGVARAYAVHKEYIAFSRIRYINDPSPDRRAKTLVHELAHYSWNAGHADDASGDVIVENGKPVVNLVPVNWPTALQGADRFAEYAWRLGTGKLK
jgi:hypothetical protein